MGYRIDEAPLHRDKGLAVNGWGRTPGCGKEMHRPLGTQWSPGSENNQEPRVVRQGQRPAVKGLRGCRYWVLEPV